MTVWFWCGWPDSSWPMCNLTLCAQHTADVNNQRPLVVANKCACDGCPLQKCDAAAAVTYSTECAASYRILEQSQQRALKMAADAAAARR